MAGPEVLVSSGDLLTVKNEEGESNGNNHKTQVMLHLPPILQGVNCDIADTATTVLAVETHHEDSSEEGEEVEYGYPITCGDSRAVLLFKKFVCPGINVRCVKFNDQLISPKQFVHLAGKATLKDWKRAIRLGGVMLRKMMDSGQIDFYQHDTVCSNTCRSTKFDVVINSTRLPSGKIMQPNSSCLALDTSGGQVPVLTVEVVHDAAEEPLEEKLSTAAQMSPGPAQPVTPITANGYAAKKKRADTPDGVLSLWKGVADSGLMVEVLSSLHTELLATLKGVEDRSEKASLHEADAIILNSLCKMFGLLDSVKQALNLKRSQVEVHNDYVLDEILGKQKEQVRDKKKIKSVKHIRSQYPNRSESRGLSFLYPVKTSQGSQPPSATGSSAACYSQLTVKPHLFRHFSSSTGRYQYARAGRRDSDGHSTTQDGVHEVNEMGYQEIFHRFRKEAMKKEDASEIQQEPIHRTEEEPLLINEEVEEKESFNHIPKVAKERLAVKKPKSK